MINLKLSNSEAHALLLMLNSIHMYPGLHSTLAKLEEIFDKEDEDLNE